jgi:hypothetical protein
MEPDVRAEIDNLKKGFHVMLNVARHRDLERRKYNLVSIAALSEVILEKSEELTSANVAIGQLNYVLDRLYQMEAQQSAN